MYGAYAFLRSASSVAPCHRMFGARLRRDFDGQGESEFSTFAVEFPLRCVSFHLDVYHEDNGHKSSDLGVKS